MMRYDFYIVLGALLVALIACVAIMIDSRSALAARLEWYRGDKTARALAYGASVKAMAEKAKKKAEAAAKSKA